MPQSRQSDAWPPPWSAAAKRERRRREAILERILMIPSIGVLLIFAIHMIWAWLR